MGRLHDPLGLGARNLRIVKNTVEGNRIMRRSTVSASLLATLLVIATGVVVASDEEVHWGYQGDEDPAHWGELTPEFSLCGTGVNQSPIDLEADFNTELPELVFDYEHSVTRMLNNGHTIQESVKPGNWLTFADHRFELQQAHFHSPSEHTIRGKAFPMEVHLVHSDSEGRLAVVGILVEHGEENPLIRKLWSEMPENAGDEAELSDRVILSGLLPPTRDYFTYNGSLTTPPCSEGVLWLVLKQTVKASREQVRHFHDIVGLDNNRPIQPQNSRMVLD